MSPGPSPAPCIAGVPAITPAFVSAVCSSTAPVCFTRPKSSTLTKSHSARNRQTKMFAGFTSRWIRPRWCASASERQAWIAEMYTARSAGTDPNRSTSVSRSTPRAAPSRNRTSRPRSCRNRRCRRCAATGARPSRADLALEALDRRLPTARIRLPRRSGRISLIAAGGRAGDGSPSRPRPCLRGREAPRGGNCPSRAPSPLPRACGGRSA